MDDFIEHNPLKETYAVIRHYLKGVIKKAVYSSLEVAINDYHKLVNSNEWVLRERGLESYNEALIGVTIVYSTAYKVVKVGLTNYDYMPDAEVLHNYLQSCFNLGVSSTWVELYA